MREKLQAELVILMNTLPLYEKESLRAAQQVNINPNADTIQALMDAGSAYRAQVSLVNFIVRVLDEVPE